MSGCIIPEGYTPRLNVYETQRAIEFIKRSFQKNLGSALNLKRVSAPLFVRTDTGLNDDLNGIERPVSFDVPAVDGAECQVVQSLAKWKRWALREYNFYEGKGLYTDMNAIRRDEAVLDNLHSVYVDQWDWEKVIREEDRNLSYLKDAVRRIVTAICMTGDELEWEFPQLQAHLSRDVSFITSQELEDMYPELTPSERENEYTKTHPTCFIMQIGKTLRSGKKHDGRAPDYDDWAATPCSTARLRCPPWVSASVPRAWTASSRLPAAMSAGLCRSTRRCSPGKCPSRWAAVSASRGFACCSSAARTSAKCSPAFGMKKP